MAQPLVSIITPTHGRAPFLPLIYYCIQSQEWTTIEWLVDDDSPQPSLFMQNLADPRVQYFHSPDRRSVGVKRNTLVQLAKGMYVAHFDDDDYYAPDYLSHLIGVLMEKNADFVKLSGFFVYSRTYEQWAYWDLMINTGLHFIWSAHPEEAVVLTPQNNQNFQENHLGYGFSYLYRKEVGDRVKFPDVSWNEDVPFIVAAAANGVVTCVPDTTGLCLHILHRDNSSKCFPQFVIPLFLKERIFSRIGPYWQALDSIQG